MRRQSALVSGHHQEAPHSRAFQKSARSSLSAAALPACRQPSPRPNAGHDVTLYEKSDKLGGQALFSDGMWFKQEMKAFREYLIRQVHKSGVHVLMNVESHPEN